MSPEPPEAGDTPRGHYRREGTGLEFDRASFFTDAVYAIAMTLLVVDLGVPHVADSPAALATALREDLPGIIGFVIGFAVLGRYWYAHHQFFAALGSIDGRLIALNLVYLAFVAFSPFPVGLISDYADEPLAFVIFAGSMAMISALEVVMFLDAARRGYTRIQLSPAVVRYGAIAAGTPVAVMLLSIPLAYLSPALALLSWLLMIPLGRLTHRNAPPGAEVLR